MADTVSVVIGQIVKAHGVKGDAVVALRTDEPSIRFKPGTNLQVEGYSQNLVVRAAHRQGDRLVVSFDGITTRDAVEALRGAVLAAEVPINQQPADDSEYYDRHLVGLRACQPDDSTIGQVVEVIHGPAQDILVIQTATGSHMVPFVGELVPQVDLAGGRLVVADLPGLLSEAGNAH